MPLSSSARQRSAGHTFCSAARTYSGVAISLNRRSIVDSKSALIIAAPVHVQGPRGGFHEYLPAARRKEPSGSDTPAPARGRNLLPPAADLQPATAVL